MKEFWCGFFVIKFFRNFPANFRNFPENFPKIKNRYGNRENSGKKKVAEISRVFLQETKSKPRNLIILHFKNE